MTISPEEQCLTRRCRAHQRETRGKREARWPKTSSITYFHGSGKERSNVLVLRKQCSLATGIVRRELLMLAIFSTVGGTHESFAENERN